MKGSFSILFMLPPGGEAGRRMSNDDVEGEEAPPASSLPDIIIGLPAPLCRGDDDIKNY